VNYFTADATKRRQELREKKERQKSSKARG
jgi:hypothetical protein